MTNEMLESFRWFLFVMDPDIPAFKALISLILTFIALQILQKVSVCGG